MRNPKLPITIGLTKFSVTLIAASILPVETSFSQEDTLPPATVEAVAGASVELAEAQDEARQEWNEVLAEFAVAKRAALEGRVADWSGLTARASGFAASHPESKWAAEARGLTTLAELLEAGRRGAVKQELKLGVQAQIEGAEIPEHSRYALRSALQALDLRERAFADRESMLAEREKHARALMREFPNQPGGYGYLLSLAKAQQGEHARALAEDLLSSAASDEIKAGAQRVLDRLALVGSDVAESLELPTGRKTLLYTWKSDRPPHSGVAAAIAAEIDLQLIGINLDEDESLGREAARQWRLPPGQIYSGGIDSDLARSLAITMPASVYFLDAQGVIIDVDGHRDLINKLASLAGAELTQPLLGIGGAK